MKEIKQYWFRFYKNGFGICFTHKDNALFSLRNGYTKSLFIFNYYIYFLPKINL